MTREKRKVLYAGSFDPITLGHMDIIQRVANIFQEVIVGIAVNTRKKALLTTEERLTLIQEATKDYSNVRPVAYRGMTIAYASEIGAHALIRGLRDPGDFHIEFQMAITNKTLASNLETIFFASRPEYTFINSSLVREVAASGGDITPFVPKNIVEVCKRMLDAKKSFISEHPWS